MNYYNEIDPFAAAWLRELIKAGHIAQGEVDERDIQDIVPSDLRGYRQCHFFAGIGVWSYALRLAGWSDESPVWTGSCPCQPFSAAGKRGGTADERHLWPAFYHLISECRPLVVFGEQVASNYGIAWFDTVASDMEGGKYACGAVITAAAGFKAPFPRHRLYFVGKSLRSGLSRFEHDICSFSRPAKTSERRDNAILDAWRQLETRPSSIPHLDGAPLWLAREFLHGYGNALCAPQAAAFISAAMECL